MTTMFRPDSKTIDLGILSSYKDMGKVTVTPHPTEPLSIANYTPQVQFSKDWDEVTLECRGLIFDQDGNVIARPFRKFFNYSEHQPDDLPDASFTAYEKMDGSLGILYWVGETPYIATRGSFTSVQAVKATEMLRKYDLLPFYEYRRSTTFLFEIIYPSNRIVVNYGDAEELVFIGARKLDGQDVHDISKFCPEGMRMPKVYPFSRLDHAVDAVVDGEGFVLHFSTGFRVKIKMAEYVRLHRLLTNFSNKDIWELLSRNESFDQFLDRVPDEFYDWVRGTKDKMLSEYRKIEKESRQIAETLTQQGLPQKEMAIELRMMPVPKVIVSTVFAMLSKKNYQQIIWKYLRPEYQRPFFQQTHIAD